MNALGKPVLLQFFQTLLTICFNVVETYDLGCIE
jgi:hypothetical protein